MYLIKIKNFWKNNQTKILALVGFLTIIAAILISIYQGLNFISGLRGFNFDPFLLIGIIVFVYYFNGILKNQNQILAKQQQLLEKLLTTNVSANAGVTKVKPRSLSKRVVGAKEK